MHYYLAPYAGDGSDIAPFRPATVAPEWTAVDLRPNPSFTAGWCFLAMPGRLDSAGSFYLGESLDVGSVALRNGVANRLGVTLSPGVTTLRQILPELLLVLATDDGSRWKRLTSTVNNSIEIVLGGEVVWSQRVVSGGATESFNKANGELGPDLTWEGAPGNNGWAVASNRGDIYAVNAASSVRAEADTATANNYAQAVLHTLTAASPTQFMPGCRWSSSAATFYGFMRENDVTNGQRYVLRKSVAGSRTDLASYVTESLSLPETIKVSADGSTITGYIGGVQKQQVTDTSITGHTRAGLYGYGDGTGNVVVDNFEMGDVSAPTSIDNLLNPYADVSNAGSWTTDSGGTTSLYAAIDENVLSDTDFIQSPVGPSTSVYETALEQIADPSSSSGHIVHYRYKKSLAADAIDLTVGLYQDTTLIASWTHNDISASFVTADQTLSGGQADAITNYATLRLRFTANMTANSTTPSKVADRQTANSNSTVTTVDLSLASMTVGNVLVIRTAADNSGGGGAARTVAATNQSGTPIGTVFGNYQQNADPGAASAGTTCNVIVVPITATSGTVRLTYSGSVVQSCVAEEWTGINVTTPVIGTPVGGTGTTTALGGAAGVADASVASGNVAYAVVAAEGPTGDTYTQDADSTNGTWSSLTKLGTSNATADTNQTTYGGYKIVSATGGQTYNATINNARDSAVLVLELAKGPATSRAQVSWAGFEVPAASTSATVTPGVITTTSSVYSVVLSVSIVVANILTTAVIPSPSLVLTSISAPASLTTASSVDAVVVIRSALVDSVTLITGSASPSPTILSSISATVSASVVETLVTLPSATISISTSTTVSPNGITTDVTGATPVVSTSSSLIPSNIATIVENPASVISVSSVVFGVTIHTATELNVVSIVQTATVSVAHIVASTAIGVPTVSGVVNIQPLAIVTISDVVQPSVTITALVSAAMIDTLTASQSPVISDTEAVSVSVISTVTVVHTPIIDSVVKPSVIAVSSVVFTPSVITSVALQVSSVASVVVLENPEVISNSSVFVANVSTISEAHTPNVATSPAVLVVNVVTISNIGAVFIGNSANVTPSVITTESIIFSSLISTGATPALDVIATHSLLGDVEAKVGVTLSFDVISLTSTIPVVAIGTAEAIFSNTIITSVSIPTPVLSVGILVPIDSISTSSAIEASATTGGSVALLVLATTTSVLNVTVNTGVVVDIANVATSIYLETVALVTNSLLTPTSVESFTSLDTLSVEVGNSATVSGVTVSTGVAVYSGVILSDSVASVASVGTEVQLGSPVVVDTEQISLTAISTSIFLGVPVILTGNAVTPLAISTATIVGNPSIAITIGVQTVVTNVELAQPVVSVGVAANTTSVATALVVSSPTVTRGAVASPSGVATTSALSEVAVATSSQAVGGISTAVVVPIPQVALGFSVVEILTTSAIFSPVLLTGSTISVGVISTSTTVWASGSSTSTSVQPTSISTSISVDASAHAHAAVFAIQIGMVSSFPLAFVGTSSQIAVNAIVTTSGVALPVLASIANVLASTISTYSILGAEAVLSVVVVPVTTNTTTTLGNPTIEAIANVTITAGVIQITIMVPIAAAGTKFVAIISIALLLPTQTLEAESRSPDIEVLMMAQSNSFTAARMEEDVVEPKFSTYDLVSVV